MNRAKLRALQIAALLLGVAAIIFGAVEISEQPTDAIFGPQVTRGPRTEKIVALTFDDGPNPPYTTRILRVLRQEHVHATFFVVGRAVRAYPSVVRQEVQDGNAVGNHTWDHRHLIVMTPSAIARSLRRTDAAIYAAAGVHTDLMRPPFGARDWIVMHTVRRLGYRVVMWSVPLARDWRYPSPRVIARRILRYVRDGSIIVLHDGNRGLLCARDHLNPHICDRTNDIAATRIIVETLKREGYRFVTIPQMIAARKVIAARKMRAAAR